MGIGVLAREEVLKLVDDEWYCILVLPSSKAKFCWFCWKLPALDGALE